MSIDELQSLCNRLKDERKRLKELEGKVALCRLSGHQVPISVNIGEKIHLNMTDMDRGYAQRLIRGREMIMLGVKKALNALVDNQREQVAELEQAIADARISV